MLLLLCALIAGGSALVLGTTGALGGPSPSLFQLDGDATTQTSPAVGDDWDKVFAGTSGAFSSKFIPYSQEGPSTKTVTRDTTAWTPSTTVEDPISSWSWQDNTSVINDKADITDAFAAAYKDGNNTSMYFGLDRLDNSGDASVGFWFLQDPSFSLNADHTFNGQHMTGDVFIKSEFLNGGGVAAPVAYKWVDGTGLVLFESGAICTTAQQNLCAIDNDGSPRPGAIDVPWEYTAKGGSGQTQVGENGFFEGGINLAGLFPEGIPCFTHFIAQTATSAGNSETLKDLAVGVVASCGTIQLKKVWSGTAGNATLNIGKTAGAADVATATANGQNGETAATEVSADTYYVSENVTGASLYSSSLACVNGAQPVTPSGTGGVAVGVGDNVVCTYTNTRKTGTVEVKKTLVPSGDPGRFDFAVGSSSFNGTGTGYGNGGTTGPLTKDTGHYAVSESAHQGTDASNYSSTWSCTQGEVTRSGVGTSVTGGIDVGNVPVVCAFTNTRLQGTVELKKVWVGAAGEVTLNIGSSAGGDQIASTLLQGTNGTTGPKSVNPGTYHVSEDVTSPDDFDTALACVNDATDKTVTPDGNGGFAVASGDHIVCTFTNTRLATIDIVKHTLGSAGSFDFTINDRFEHSADFTLTTDSSGGTDTLHIVGVPAGDYSVVEAAQAGWALTGLSCSTGDNESLDRGSRDATNPNQANIHITAGGFVQCTYTNTKLATLIVKKVVDNSNGGGSKGPGDFSLHVSSGGSELPGSPAAGSSSGTTYTGLMPGTYKVSEDAVSGYNLTGISGCLADGSVVLEAGATVTCTLTNTSNAPPPSPPPPPPPAPKVDLQITKTGTPNPATVGNQVTWTMVVTNNGPNGATGVTVADPVPAGTTFVSVASSAGTCTGGAVINCQLGSLPVGASVTITLVTTANAKGTLTNTATTVAQEQETNTANNTATATVVVNGVFVPPVRYCTAISVSPKKTLFVGRRTTLTLKVSQNGKPVKGIRIKINGAKLAITTAPSNARGLVKVTVTPKRAGIVRFAPVSTQGCANPRIGVAGVFTPPVTG